MGFAKSSTHPTACALFAQYRNFEIRGGSFRDLVTALSGVKPVV
jgi:UDP-N-acetylmuramoylalanine--D-glutamate ligase